MGKRNEFPLNTSGYCFICLKHDAEVGEMERVPEAHTSLRNMFQYLKTNLRELFSDMIPTLPSTLPVLEGCVITGTLCQECVELYEKFSRDYLELEVLRIKVEWRLKAMAERMDVLDGNGSKFQNKMLGKSETLFHYSIVDQLRKKTVEECGKLIGDAGPRVVLPRTDYDFTEATIIPTPLQIERPSSLSSMIILPSIHEGDFNYSNDGPQLIKRPRLDHSSSAQGGIVDGGILVLDNSTSVGFGGAPSEASPIECTGNEDVLVKIEQDLEASAYNDDLDANEPLIDIGEVKVERHSGNSFHGDISSPASPERLHPLQNPKLLTNLFSVCPSALLATCRLVCVAWRDESLPFWRSCSTLVVNYSEGSGSRHKYVSIGDEWSSGSRDSLLEFITFWGKECKTIPYQKLRLHNWEFGLRKEVDPVCHYEDKTEQFLQMVGSNITQLHLRWCTFSTVQEFRKQISKTFPNLESLIVQGSRLVSASDTSSTDDESPKDLEVVAGEHLHLTKLSVTGQRPTDWTELFHQFPLLTTLKRTYCTYRNRPFMTGMDKTRIQQDVQTMLLAIKVVRGNYPDKLPLKHFAIQPPLELSMDEESHQIFSLIRELSLPLSSVKIKLDCDPNVVDHTVALHSKVLTQIQVVKDEEGHCDLSPISPKLCNFLFREALENLKELTISDQVCTNMKFLKNTPNLEILRMFENLKDYYISDNLDTRIVADTPKTGMTNVKLPKLKQLYIGYVVREEDLQSLSTWLPNVTVYSGFLNDEQFAVVCENWRELEHLHVLGGELTDIGVTGIEKKYVTAKKKSQGRKKKKFEVQAVTTRPNLTLLQSLRCFKIEDELSNLTDISAFEGFLKLPNLQWLDLYSYNNQFGKEATEALEQKIPNCTTCGPYNCMRLNHHKGELFRERYCGYLE